MTRLRDSLSRKLTAMNLLVSGGALMLASTALFAYDLVTFRGTLLSGTTIQAQIIAANSVSPLIFNDAKSAEATLSALRTTQHIIYAAVYTLNGEFMAGYWRGQGREPLPLPPFNRESGGFSKFEGEKLDLVQTIDFQGKTVGFVYIRSDLGALSERWRTYGVILLSVLGVSLVAALVLSRIAQRKIARPVLRLAETARQVSREKNYMIRAQLTEDQDEVGLLVESFNDMLHEIQKRDTALQESESQFRVLADSIPQMAWMTDKEGAASWFNRRWYDYTGTTPEEMEGYGWESVHDPEILPKVLATWKNCVRTGQPYEITFPLRGADGNFRLFLTLALPVRDAHGKIVRWFGTNTDVTDQRRSEEALRQTEKLAATGRLAASIAHEINNPLEAVTNLVYLARIQPSNLEKYLKLADQELERIAQITKNTLGFYRDTASPAPVDISEILEEVVALYSRKLNFKRIRLQSEYGDRIVVEGFPGEIRQIFANLLSNAIEAMSEKGRLRIGAKQVHGRGNLTAIPGVRITFLDNGTGIPPERIKKIFEPFYTTKKDVGTGLGLWLTLGLVAKHHGQLRVRSSVRPGRTGTAFSLFLPESQEDSSKDGSGSTTKTEAAS